VPFFQLAKVEGTKVTGVLTAEVPDRDNEVLDYDASKPNFITWSQSVLADSGGKSKGNVRFQHNANRPVGRLTDIRFDDARKQITATAEIIEQEARDLLEAGVLTGFSIGGGYQWKRLQPDGMTRYAALPSEISVVDRPCVPNATFQVIKAGVTLEKRFPNAEASERDLITSARRRAAKELLLKGYPTGMVAEALQMTGGEIGRLKKTTNFGCLRQVRRKILIEQGRR